MEFCRIKFHAQTMQRFEPESGQDFMIIVLLLKRYQSNNCDNMPIIGIGRKSAMRIYWPVRAQGVANPADLLLEEFSHGAEQRAGAVAKLH
jgi:hypothetical protein